MAVNPSSSFVWRGTPSTTLNRIHNVVADSQFSQVIGTNTPFQVTTSGSGNVLSFNFWLGSSNATWQNFFPGGWTITSWSNFSWTYYQLRIFQGTNVQFWNKEIEVTLQLPTVTTYPNTQVPISSSQVTVKLDGVVLKQGGSSTDDYSINFINLAPPTGAITTVNTISRSRAIIPVWDDYSNSNLEFPGVTNPNLINGGGTLSSNFSVSGQGSRRRPGSASLSADSNLIAAPGRIKLLEASLTSDFETDAEYLDPSYFTDIYAGGGPTAKLILGGIANPQVTTSLSAQGNVIYSFSASIQSLTQLLAEAGYVRDALASLESSFALDAVTGIIHDEDAAVESTFNTDFQGGRIYSIESSAQVETASTPQGNMIYDVGVQYALDWVGIDQDYVQPYYYLGLQADTEFDSAGQVFRQLESRLFSEFNLEAVAGFLKQIDSQISASSAIDNITGVIIGSTSFQAESDFSSLMSGGRIFAIDDALFSDFTSDFQGNRLIQTTYEPIEVDSEIGSVIDLFSGAQSFVSVETSLLGVGGYFLPIPLQAYSSQFVMPTTQARVIALDEYYFDVVLPETRLIFIPLEPRTVEAQSETRQITIHEEPTTMIVNEETRINKPELGRSYLVGQRTRRVAA